MIPNSPQGNQNTNFSGYHRNIPDPLILKLYLEQKKHPAIPKAHPLLLEFIKEIENKKVLDLGCGLGSTFCKVLLDYGLKPQNLYSLDADKKNFDKDEYPRINKIIASAEKTPFEDNFFDLIHSSELTLDHPKIDFILILKEISRILKKGGIYLANEHFEENLEFTQQLKLLELERKSQEMLKIINDKKIMEKIGFKPLIRIKYLESPLIKPSQFIFYLLEKN